MKQPLRHLIIGTAVGVFSLGAYAQSTSMTPPPPTSPKMTTGTMSDGDYNAAKAACNAQTGAARSDCLRKAKTAHDQGETNKGSGGTDASSGGGQSGASSGNAGTTGAPRVERRAPAPRAAQRVERPVVTLAVPRVAARRVERPVVTLVVPRVAAQRVERPVVTLAGPQAATAADRNK